MQSDPSERWRADRLWAPVYAFALNRPALARLGGRIGLGTDLSVLYDAIEAAIAGRPAGTRILDVPCGGGVAVRALAPGGGIEYVAADIAPAMLERTAAEAARRGVVDQVRTRRADIGALADPDASFDVVVSFTGLHCVPDPRRGFGELVRVLRPGGTLSVSLLVRDAPPWRMAVQVGGRIAGLVGPSATEAEVRAWVREAPLVRPRFRRSGELLYLTATAP